MQGSTPASASPSAPFSACYNPIVTLFDELRSIVTALDGAGVEYALAGGLAPAWTGRAHLPFAGGDR